MSAFNNELWDSAFSAVKEQFNINSLFREQTEGFIAFIEKSSNVFVTLPTVCALKHMYSHLPTSLTCLSPLLLATRVFLAEATFSS